MRVLGAGDQRLVVAAGVEEAALRRVPELLDHDVGQVQGRLDPARLERRLVQRHQGVDQEGVILQVGVQLGRRAGAAGAQQPAVGRAHPCSG